jgi:scyllo-inositol 2-dehydrogenase (NADP+)
MADGPRADRMDAPLRLGIVGLGRTGMHHLERLTLRSDCRLIAVYDEIPERTQAAAGFDCRCCESFGELIDAEFDLLLIATPPAAHASLALAGLAAGKHVAVEPPLALTSTDADAIFDAARRAGRRVDIVHNRRWDGDFRTAMDVLRSGELGRLQAVKLVVWEYAYPSDSPLREQTGWRNDASQGGGVLMEFGPRYFDQLLQMTDSPPRSVLTALYRTGPADGPDSGFAALIQFADGITAHIDVHLASPVPMNTGWLLTGTGGGYKPFRRYSVTPEGEVFDVPIDPLPTDWDGFYASLFDRLTDDPACSADEQQARCVISLLEAAQESARSGEVVQLIGRS